LGLFEGETHLPQQVHDALGGQRALPKDHLDHVEAVDELHRKKEHAVFAPAVLEDLYRMRRAEARRGLGFAVKAPPIGLFALCTALALGMNQLHRGTPREERMIGPPHLAHAAFAELLDEFVAAEAARRQLGLAHTLGQVGDGDREDSCHQVRVVEPHPAGEARWQSAHHRRRDDVDDDGEHAEGEGKTPRRGKHHRIEQHHQRAAGPATDRGLSFVPGHRGRRDQEQHVGEANPLPLGAREPLAAYRSEQPERGDEGPEGGDDIGEGESPGANRRQDDLPRPNDDEHADDGDRPSPPALEPGLLRRGLTHGSEW